MWSRQSRWTRLVRARFNTKCAAHGLYFPPWIVLLSAAAQIGCATIAVWQREALIPPEPIALAPLIVVAGHLQQCVVRAWVPTWVLAALTLVAAGWIMSEPLQIGAADLTMGLLAIMVAEVTATEGGRIGALVTVPTVGLVAWHWTGDWIGVAEVAFGLVVGLMLRSQNRTIIAERAAREHASEQATLAERQRVAREIHDLVGHSLSVTMLHVTASRRALEDAEGAPDSPGAVQESIREAHAALVDAERIGREAMSEIRRTVSVLASESSGTAPLPGAADLPHLVSDAAAAGVAVAWRLEGELARIPAATGLALYRVMQECLANAVRHAPGAPLTVRLLVTDAAAVLTTTNPLPPRPALGRSTEGFGGNGVPGLRARAEQAGGRVEVGALRGVWRVEFAVPLEPGAALSVDRAAPVPSSPLLDATPDLVDREPV